MDADYVLKLIDIFMSNLHPTVFAHEYEHPWALWRRYAPLEEIIHDAINIVTSLRAPTVLETSEPSVSSVLLQRTELTIRRVEATAVRQPIGSTAFNSLLTVNSTGSAGIACSLYLTVRLHLMEALQDFVEFAADTMYWAQAVDLLARLPSLQRCAEELLVQLTSVLRTHCSPGSGEPRSAFRMFCLSWPLLVIDRSRHVSFEAKCIATALLQRDEL